MIRSIHFTTGVLAASTIACFFISTLLVELFGGQQPVAAVKRWIVMPGLLVLVPAVAAAGWTGFSLAKSRTGRLVLAKKKRMPFIGANGLFILVPCAFILRAWANGTVNTAGGDFHGGFYAVQALELLAGGTNIFLMGSNIRDGLRLTGRLPSKRPAQSGEKG